MLQRGVTFYLNRHYVYCQYYAYDGRVNVSAGIKVSSTGEGWMDKLSKAQSAHLKRLQTLVHNYEGNCLHSGARTSREEIEAIIAEATGKRHVPKQGETLVQIVDRYIEAVRAGDVLNKGKRYSDSWINNASVVSTALKQIPIASKPAAFITEGDLSQIDAALTVKPMYRKKNSGEPTKYGAARNTVANYMAVLIGILNKTRRLKWHEGKELDTVGVRSMPEDIDHGVYLSTDELARLSALPYEGEAAMLRDAFVLGCLLGMRHSDLSRLTPSHKVGGNVNINTKKTGTPVWVPLSPQAKEIWERLGGKVTLPIAQTFIAFIQRMAKEAGIDQRTLFSRTEGGKKVERWLKKYELLGTHTMRRSFSTNAFKAGVPMPSIMKVTGHKSTASFLKYIRLSDEEHATLLAAHPYFSK